jgi:uncharacterized protein (TIGR02466 family)
VRHLFTTRIADLRLGTEPLRQDLERCAWLLASEDEAGNEWCQANGYDGYTSYASLDDLPRRFPEFARLKKLLDREAGRFAQASYWDLEGFALRLDALWVNILTAGGQHSGHIHPGSVISGTYYVSTPEGAGQIRFEDPRLGLMMAAPQLISEVPDEFRRFVYVQPVQGSCLLWESWLRHEVMPGNSQDARISVSFNYGLVRRP